MQSFLDGIKSCNSHRFFGAKSQLHYRYLCFDVVVNCTLSTLTIIGCVVCLYMVLYDLISERVTVVAEHYTDSLGSEAQAGFIDTYV